MARVYRRAGRIEGVHGTRGEVRFRPADGASNPLATGQTVVLVPPTLEDRRRKRVARVREDGDAVYLTFSDVSDRGGAMLCVGRTVLVLAEDLPRDWMAETADGLVGLDVVDADRGAIGRVVAVEGGPAQSLLVVEGSFGEVLIPAVEPLVGEVRDGVLSVECPPGLIDLADPGRDD